jgi:hypothetical protein
MKVLGFCTNCNNSITITDFVDPDVGLFECAKCHTFMPSAELKKTGVMGLHYEDEHLHHLFSETLTAEDEIEISKISEYAGVALNTKHGSVENMLRLCTMQDLTDSLTWEDMLKLHKLIKRKMAEHLTYHNTSF